MREYTRVPSYLPKVTGKRGKDVREWLLRVENACRINDITIEDTNTRLPGIAGSSMGNLASDGGYRVFNGEYSVLIFRVEGMSILDQMLCYTNGLMPRTRSYVKLENPVTLSAVMDLAVKYEMTHYFEGTRDRQVRQGSKKSTNDAPKPNKSFKGNPFERKGASNRSRTPSGLIIARFTFARSQGTSRLIASHGRKVKTSRKATNRASEWMDKAVTRTLKFENISLRVLCENPLVYKSRPLFSITGEIRASVENLATRGMLLDCGATTIYVFKHLGVEHQLQTAKFRDNQIVEAELEVIPLEIESTRFLTNILGAPFFEDMHPQIEWRGKTIEGTKAETLHWERTSEIRGPIEEGGLVIASGLRRSVEAKGLSAKRPDSSRGAALETDVTSAVELARYKVQKESPNAGHGHHQDTLAGNDTVVNGEFDSHNTRGKDNLVGEMFTMSVVDEVGVQTKYIT
ncbi:Hypothetical protein PHPALM_3451 [Phytophthora palmivora]|uniref:Uncharacterized protein n=1 Tax=Phytophthora palmivora TaxID=4796 RepID=A0A2P4YMB2_9STRA|nr:Hypothetical protein PHPALM_3451 [Phytophthora palmivora]